MHQDRKEDINNKAIEFKEKMIALEKDYDYVDEKLKYLQKGSVQTMTLNFESGRGFLLRPNHDSVYKNLSNHRAQELQDIVDRITDSTFRAIVTFLEGQREIIIQEINRLAAEKLK